MTPTRQGSLRLFRLWGIDVHVHWTWLIVAMYSVSSRVPNYETPGWALAEYLSLFVIVTMHEFGHALACRQVGGQANQIVLWPLGGVAYVAPPQRPGATLWSIAAGPLVNVALVPVLYGLWFGMDIGGMLTENPDLNRFMSAVNVMNVTLLIFNLLPVYPLDGGQILRSILWYPFGRGRSLLFATGVGLVGGVGIIGLAVWWQSLWLGIMSFFLLANSWSSFKHAQEVRRIERLPRRPQFRCPECHSSPPIGNFWLCPSCRQPFDPFATQAVCPHCSSALDLTACPDCGTARAHRSWDASIRDA